MNKFLKGLITLLIIFVIAEGAIIGYDIYQKHMNNKKEDNSKIEKNEDKDKEIDDKEKEKKNKDEEEYDKIISSTRRLQKLLKLNQGKQ